MAETRQVVLDIQVRSKDAQKQLEEVQKRLKENSESQKLLNKQLKDGEISLDAYGQATTAVKLDSAELRKEQSSLTRQILNSTKATDASEGSNEQLRAQLSLLTAEYNSLSKAERTNTERGNELRIQTRALSDELKENEKIVGDNRRNVGNYSSAFEGLSGVLDNLIPGFGNLSSKIKEVNQSGGGLTGIFQAIKGVGPAAVITAVTGAAIAASKAIFDLTKEYTALQDSVEQLTGATGETLDAQTGRIQGLAKTFDQDFNEILLAANATAQATDKTIEEALDEIEKGFVNGANASGQYLDQLTEYPTQLAGVGLSLEEINGLILQAEQQGIFGDKALDSIKEAGIRLRELTPATQDALEGIGISADAVQQGLSDGSLSLKDVIQDVSGRLGELEANSPEVGAAIADIFGGPGEDAGIEFLKTLNQIPASIDDVSKASEETTTRLNAQLTAQQELSLASSELASEFKALVSGSGNFTTSLKTGLIQVVLDLVRFFKDLFQDILPDVREGFDRLREVGEKLAPAFSAIGDIIGTLIGIFVKVNVTVGKAIFAFLEFFGVFDLIGKIASDVSSFFTFISNLFTSFVDGIKAAGIELELFALKAERAFTFDDDKLAEIDTAIDKLENFKKELKDTRAEADKGPIETEVSVTETINAPTPAQLKAAADAAKKRAEAEAKAREAARAKAEKARADAAKAEAERQKAELAALKQGIEDRIAEERLGLIRIEQNRLISDERKEQLTIERQKRLIDLQQQLALVGLNEESAQAKLIVAQAEAEIAQIQIDANNKTLEAKLDNDQRERDSITANAAAEKKAADERVRVNLEAEEAKRAEAEETQRKLDELNQLAADSIAGIEQSLASGDLINTAAIIDNLIEQFEEGGLTAGQKFAAGLGAAAAGVAGVLSLVADQIEVVDRESAERARKVQIAQLIFSGISSAAQAFFRAIATFGFPAGPIIGGAQSALIAGITATQVGRLRSEPLAFAEGGFTGSGFGSPDSSGFKPAGIVHAGEYVVPSRVLAQPVARSMVNRLEGMRVGGYAAGGFVGVTAQARQVEDQVNQSNDIARALLNAPAPVVDVREINTVQRRVSVKQNTGNL